MSTELLRGSAVVLEALSRLAIARGALLDDTTAEVYLDAITDVSPGLIARACRDLAKLARGEYETAMPSVGTIRETAQNLARAEALDASRLLPAHHDERTYRCHRCQDDPGGWLVLMRCPEIRCERPKDHQPHYFTARCPCWLKRNAHAIRYAAEQAERKRQTVPWDLQWVDQLEEGRYRWEKPITVAREYQP